jgi:hypothetical protein
MFAENGLEKLGTTMYEISKLNFQMYYIWLNYINKKTKSEHLKTGKENLGHKNWKKYAQELEKSLKEINDFRINADLKNDLRKRLDIYNLESWEKEFLILRCEFRKFGFNLS